MIAAASRDSATEEFGRRLQAARKAKGWTQVRFAEEAGVSVNMIRFYEQGRTFPQVDRVLQLCRVLGVTIDQLIPVTPADWRDR